MKYLQTFNERKFYTIKYDNHDLTIDDIKRGEWSLKDHLDPKIAIMSNFLSDIRYRVNTKGSRVYSDEVDKIDQMYQIMSDLNTVVKDDIDQVSQSGDIDENYPF